MCEASSLIRRLIEGVGESSDRSYFSDSDTLSCATAYDSCSVELYQTTLLESLILAQDERWRRA